MEKTIAMLPGEGIGSEVLAQAEKVLRSIGTRFGHRFTFVQVGGGLSGPLTEEQLSSCLAADSVLAGVGVGRGISQLSQELNLKANMRPALLYPQLAGASPLAPALVKQDIDLMLVQALAGIRALEQGEESPAPKEEEDAVRVARIAFRAAGMRRGGLVFVEQPGQPARNRCWRELLGKVAAGFPRVSLRIMGATAAAQLFSKAAVHTRSISPGSISGRAASCTHTNRQSAETSSSPFSTLSALLVPPRTTLHSLLMEKS